MPWWSPTSNKTQHNSYPNTSMVRPVAIETTCTHHSHSSGKQTKWRNGGDFKKLHFDPSPVTAGSWQGWRGPCQGSPSSPAAPLAVCREEREGEREREREYMYMCTYMYTYPHASACHIPGENFLKCDISRCHCGPLQLPYGPFFSTAESLHLPNVQ